MAIRTVFFDIDGTLLDEQKQIPESAKQAVRQLQESGVETVIATGRPPVNFEWIREELGIHSYVSLNGNYVVREGELIFDNPIPAELVTTFKATTMKNGHGLGLVSHDEYRLTLLTHEAESCLGNHGLTVPTVAPSFDEEHKIYQCLLFADKNTGRDYEQQFSELHVMHWDELAADVQLRGSSKALGIEHYLQAAGVKQEDSMAFGDGINDLEMLQYVGTGIAMGNAGDALKGVADKVTLKASEGGIAAALQELGLIQAMELESK